MPFKACTLLHFVRVVVPDNSSLFVTVIFSNSKRLYINGLQKLPPFSKNYPEICHIS